jgi:hypothetical protein
VAATCVEQAGRSQGADAPAFDLIVPKLLRPLVRPGTIGWSLLIGWPGDGGARSVASVVQEQARVRP